MHWIQTTDRTKRERWFKRRGERTIPNNKAGGDGEQIDRKLKGGINKKTLIQQDGWNKKHFDSKEGVERKRRCELREG